MREMLILAPVFAGVALDCVFGDPQRLPHPIRLMGRLTGGGEKLLRKLCRNHVGEYICGAALCIFVTAVSFLLPFLLLVILDMVNEILTVAVHSVMCWQIIAAKALRTESMKVYRELENGDLDQARRDLSRIVSRDTETLTEAGVIKSTVECVSENTSDGVTAPLIFLLIWGAPLGFFYKAVNTLDSMIGYKNDEYIRFGRFAARLDDIVNYIPARITALMMIFASLICNYDWKNSIKIYRRDRRKHPSPNSAQTESACAGALGIQIAGPNYYFGKFVEKPAIGDDIRPAEREDIKKAIRLMYCTFALMLATGVLIRFAVWRLVNV